MTEAAVVAPAPSTSSSTPAANVAFLEALGSGLFYSVNYERFIDPWHLGLRLGVSYLTIPVSKYGASDNLSIFSMPLIGSYYLRFGQHRIQFGLGATVLYTSASTDSEGDSFGGERAGLGVAGAAVVGYRYVPADGGWSFGVGFTPLLRASKFLPWGGANVGYAF